jgi:hypothetical protein
LVDKKKSKNKKQGLRSISEALHGMQYHSKLETSGNMEGTYFRPVTFAVGFKS